MDPFMLKNPILFIWCSSLEAWKELYLWAGKTFSEVNCFEVIIFRVFVLAKLNPVT
jgi:hypothetical protein